MRLTPPRPAAMLTGLILILTVVVSVASLLAPTLYRDTSAFILSAWFANDLVTLFLAVPVLLIATVFALRGNHIAYFVWLGALDYTLYNFAFYLFGAAINVFFFAYVGLFVFAGLALINAFTALDVRALAAHTRPTLPARPLAGWMVVWGALLVVIWVAIWLNYMNTGEVVNLGPDGLRLIAALDLSFVVTPALLAAVWLWQRHPWGVPLALTLNVKGALYLVVLIAGSVVGHRDGIAGALDLLPLWGLLLLACLTAGGFLFAALRPAVEPAQGVMTPSPPTP